MHDQKPTFKIELVFKLMSCALPPDWWRTPPSRFYFENLTMYLILDPVDELYDIYYNIFYRFKNRSLVQFYIFQYHLSECSKGHQNTFHRPLIGQ